MRGVEALQPWEPEHKLEVAQSGDLEGEGLRVGTMDAQVRGEIVGNRTSGRDAAID